jgi:hypothetical protein
LVTVPPLSVGRDPSVVNTMSAPGVPQLREMGFVETMAPPFGLASGIEGWNVYDELVTGESLQPA